MSTNLNFILFADDTNIFLSGKNLLEVCNTMTNDLKKLDIWFKVNKLSLNVDKTNYIAFGKTTRLSKGNGPASKEPNETHNECMLHFHKFH